MTDRTTNDDQQSVPSWSAIVRSSNATNQLDSFSKSHSPVAIISKSLQSRRGRRSQGILVRPRGLLNSGNMCFLNAILQPLVHCSPFHLLYKNYASQTAHVFDSATPLTDSIILFLAEFDEELPTDGRQSIRSKKRQAKPIAPEFVYDALRVLKNIDNKGRQEDAEEFLGFLLDGLHEEFLKLQKAICPSNGHSDANGMSHSGVDVWVEVGKKNKLQTTRNTQMDSSPISEMFFGKMRSIVKSPGSKDSITLEPFQSLHLDITVTN